MDPVGSSGAGRPSGVSQMEVRGQAFVALHPPVIGHRLSLKKSLFLGQAAPSVEGTTGDGCSSTIPIDDVPSSQGGAPPHLGVHHSAAESGPQTRVSFP